MFDFSVDYKTFDTSNIINIDKCLIKKHDIKECLGSLTKSLSDY